MTEQRTEDYRDVLEELAISRGLSGAEELARRVVEVDPDFTERDILEATYGGFGPVLDRVFDPPLTEEERERIVQSLAAHGRALDLGICNVPGCKRPSDGDTTWALCDEHRRRFDAQGDVEDWELALKILRPWVQTAEPIGCGMLIRVMEGALEKAEWELRRARRECKEAEAALAL
jgi:hypothetical protein